MRNPAQRDLPALHQRPGIAQLALSDDEIIAAVEAGLLAQGRGQSVVEPSMHLTPAMGDDPRSPDQRAWELHFR